MSADNSTPPKAAGEDDKTQIAPLPKTPKKAAKKKKAKPAADAREAEEDADKTLLIPTSEVSDDDDRTLISLPPGEKTPAEPAKTPPAAAAAPGGATDRPMPERSAPQAPDAQDDRTFIAQPPKAAPHPPEALRTLERGAVINNMYRVEDRLDHGGMGRVFKGVEIGTGEPVAIKVILPEMAEDPRVTQMFRREARTLRQLHHDAIVRYFAYVPPDAHFNLHALVMGFIEGTKLSDKIKAHGPLSENQVCQLFLRLAGGLDRAHKIGVVHRDLSPDNVMLPEDDIARATLIDFGISRSSRVKDGTLGNEFAGKLKYVSPEQLGAFGGQAEAASDVYSLGLLMIVALTGEPLNMGDSIVEAVQARHSVPDLTSVPGRFQTLLYQMLQPDPAQRMKSMEEVITGLRAVQSGGTVPTIAPDSKVVPGLQAAPRASMSGDGFVTVGPTAIPSRPLPEDDANGIVKVIAVVACLAVIGGGAWYALGMPGFGLAPAAPPAPVQQDGLARLPGGQETFLAETLNQPCSFATRRVQGANAGLLEGFAADPAALSGVAPAFAAAFGMQPELVAQTVQGTQCPAVEFAKVFQGTSGGAIEMTLDKSRVSQGEGVVGTLHGGVGRENWLGLVSPAGGVFSLMQQLADPIGEQRRFSFRLPSAQPGTYMLIATASQSALVRAGAMVDGAQAVDILPLMTRELAEDGLGAVDIGVIEITP